MSEHVGLGVALVLFGGMLNGSFALPMKRMPAWRWENTWLVYSVVGMLLAPWLFAITTVPCLAEVYHRASGHAFFLVLLFGLASGTGSMLFGLGIARLGLALGFAIILGIICVVGVTPSFGDSAPRSGLEPARLLPDGRNTAGDPGDCVLRDCRSPPGTGSRPIRSGCTPIWFRSGPGDLYLLRNSLGDA